MIIDEHFSGRRVRIIGKPGDVFPFGIQILDADTGELIDHVHRVEIVLDADKEVNTARLFYYESDQAGKLKDGPVEQEITVPVAEVDVTAFEVTGGEKWDDDNH